MWFGNEPFQVTGQKGLKRETTRTSNIQNSPPYRGQLRKACPVRMLLKSRKYCLQMGFIIDAGKKSLIIITKTVFENVKEEVLDRTHAI